MNPAVYRLGFLNLSRGMAVLLLIIGVGVGAAFWIGPFRPLPADLHLQVSNATASSPSTIFVAAKSHPGSSSARFPLVLAAINNGARAAEPTILNLSIPSNYKLSRGLHGLTPEVSSGNPLVHYTIDVSGITLPADSTTYSILSDTLWLEPILGDYDCAVGADSVPEFVPPNPRSATSVSRVPVFYSFDGTSDRQTGMFTAELDSSVLHHAPTAMPPRFPSYERDPEAPRPNLGTLHQVGARTSYCGDPQAPIELYTVDWETAGGGRFLVVYMNGAPRKQLFDLDRDSIVELEMWDPNGDGRFEAWRQAQYAIPTLVLPERAVMETASNDSLMNDPRWLTTFDDTLAGPFRFLSDSARARRTPPVADTAVMRVDTLAGAVGAVGASGASGATGASGASGASGAAGSPATPPAIRIVIDTAWVRTFNNVEAGPYRFLKNPPARRASSPVDTTTRRPTPRPVRRGNRPLGRPVPMPPLNSGGR